MNRGAASGSGSKPKFASANLNALTKAPTATGRAASSQQRTCLYSCGVILWLWCCSLLHRGAYAVQGTEAAYATRSCPHSLLVPQAMVAAVVSPF